MSLRKKLGILGKHAYLTDTMWNLVRTEYQMLEERCSSRDHSATVVTNFGVTALVVSLKTHYSAKGSVQYLPCKYT